MSELRRCPQCDAEIPVNSPAGLCPRCLLKSCADSQSAAMAEPGPTKRTPPNSGFVPPTIEDLAPLFPQLEILELLGKGGMGAVYKARQPGLDRLVAVKILPPEISHDPAFAERFQREARALARLSHPHIVAVYDFGQTLECGDSSPLSMSGGAAFRRDEAAIRKSGDESPHSKSALCYIVMEFVDGANLRQTIRAGKLAAAEALAIVPQICEALQFAHDEGIVHRDIKPENILIDKRGRVKIADFGLAKLLGQDASDHSLTATHQVMGTLRYMAPEQMQGSREVDHRADIYSLGVVFYELLTGELPMGRFAPPSKKVQVDVRLDEIVLRALEADPEQRYQHASEVKTDMEMISRTPLPSVARIESTKRDDVASDRIPTGDGGGMDKEQTPATPPANNGRSLIKLLAVHRVQTVVALTFIVALLGTIVRLRSGDAVARLGMTEVERRRLTDSNREDTAMEIGSKPGDSREVTLPGGVTLKQLWCPPGSFRMGSPELEWAHLDNEKPVDVTLSQGFWLGQTEVTQAQWLAVMGTNLWEKRGEANRYRNGPSYPAVCMDHTEATEFCERLTRIEREAGRLPSGWKYALPTEAQWQYACRAGTTTIFCFGNTEDQLNDYVWNLRNTLEVGEPFAHPVATKKPNPWGFHDMHGNVEEWCRDAYSPQLPGGRDPFVAHSADGTRVFPGGSWFSLGIYCRSAFRGSNKASFHIFYLGFRLACVPELSDRGADAAPLAKNTRTDGDVATDVALSRAPKLLEGQWRVENEELITEPIGDTTWQILTFGDSNWTDYDLKVETCCNRPGLTYSVVSRFADKKNFWHLSFGAFGPTNVDLVGSVDGEGHEHPSRRWLPAQVHGKPNVWQTIEIQMRGENITAIVDGEKLATSSRDRLSNGCVGFHTFSGGLVRWRNLDVRKPNGTLLWKGFPELPLTSAPGERGASAPPVSSI